MSYNQRYNGYNQGGYGPPGCPPGIDPNIYTWFQDVDQDKSGKITSHELRQALITNNMKQFNRETCRLLIGMFDRDKDGSIDVYEFSDLWKYIHQWRQCFDGFDQDKSGSIDCNELHTSLTTFGYRLSRNFCSLIVRTFDKTSSNSIDFDYFIQVCVTLHQLTDSFRRKDKNQSGRIDLNYEEFLEMVLDNSLNIV